MSIERFQNEALADLHDEDIVVVGQIWAEISRRFSHKTNTQHNLNEMAKFAEAEFARKGFLVHVNLQGVLLNEGPSIDVVAKISDQEFDHDKKGWEVKKAVGKGEKFLGQKETYGG